MESVQFVAILVGVLIGFIILRIVLYRVLVKSLKKQVFHKDYLKILNSPEYKVKGKFEQ